MRHLPGDIFEILNTKYQSLTKSEKKIANYLFNHQNEIIQMPITTMAEECKVAEATIFRFCKALDYEGYNEFKLALAKSIFMTDAPNPTSLPPSYGKVEANDSFTEMCEKLYSSQLSALEQTFKLLDKDRIEKAVEILSKAQRVYCMGQGASLLMAMEAWGRFSTASSKFSYIEDSHFQAMSASLFGEDDVILFFSYSGATRDMTDVMRYVQANKTKVILVTKFEKSPAAAHASVVLLCDSNEGPLQVGSVAAKVAQLLVIDVLFNEFCRANAEMSLKNIEITADASARKLI
ncbi:MAG: MurR/RpiR family transcriptional regulator [Hydrogenoanaerobacterium sp.]